MSKDKRRMDSNKCIFHMDRIQAHFDRGERVAPVHIDMGIAKFCSIRCVFCFGLSQHPAPVYIEHEALLQTMKDAGEIGVRSIGLIGDGDPTCNPHWQDGLRAGRDAGVDMAISTNGYIVNNEERAKTILDTCTWMRFCISAGTREGYKLIHNRDYFDKVVANIRRIVELKHATGSKCDIGLQAVFIPTLMAQEMVELAKLAVDTGVDYCVVKQCSLPDEGQTGMMQFNLDDYDKPEIIDKLKEAESLATPNTDIVVKYQAMARKGKRRYKGCPAGPIISEMSGNGDWYCCGYQFGREGHEQYKLGNVHEKSLKEIWESEHYWEVMRKMRYEFNSETQCRGCCRLDPANEFVWNYTHKPMGINFL